MFIESIFNDSSQYGTINIRRAYGDWKDRKLQGWENVLQENTWEIERHNL